MSYTQTDVARLRSAIAKGASQVKVGEEQITFRSLAEMRSLLAEMEASVAGESAPSRQHYPQFMERP
ncbi:hypothetical protein SAMN05421774_11246 [Gemmobacter megaterium]|uniref:GpW protein n=1 Tax=Gemmobacter megaterium TaxID=1086013 RepID=A0A1N7QIV8_9RHOB|nr:hypothetical protein [Gemmobacter megaterium]GGE26657.1 hypothetical protein GCM10011345_35820 [Gemmobacter megaterium]SIT22704.1 hypothetical protein SAMN05421774_11246 [Gemmobacter megaterium]